MKPFIIYSLPRSRSKWLSTFLTYDKWFCGHDIVLDFPSLSGIQNFYKKPYNGSCETGMVDGYKAMLSLVPEAKLVVVKRPVIDVTSSLYQALHQNIEISQLYRRMELLREVANLPGVLSVDYKDLNSEATCKQIFEHCLEQPFDVTWWQGLKDKNIQINLKKRMELIETIRPELDRLREEANAYDTEGKVAGVLSRCPSANAPAPRRNWREVYP